jgi:hypothetical protein
MITNLLAHYHVNWSRHRLYSKNIYSEHTYYSVETRIYDKRG